MGHMSQMMNHLISSKTLKIRLSIQDQAKYVCMCNLITRKVQAQISESKSSTSKIGECSLLKQVIA